MTDNRTNSIDRTERGFGIYADFTDRYGERFTVQQSSLATEDAVWVGAHEKRGHLTVEMALHVRDALAGWLQDVGADEGGPALEASQGAAPQAESGSRPRVIDLAEKWADEKLGGYIARTSFMQGVRFALEVTAAPVLPSASACPCTYHSEDRGGGYSELVIEPEPSCPEHGSGLAAPELPTAVTLADLLREHRHAYSYTTGRGSRYVGCACGARPERLRGPDDAWLALHQGQELLKCLETS